MPAELNLITTPQMSPDIPALYLHDKLLDRAKRDLVFWDMAQKFPIPTGEGKTCRFTRFERLPLPEAPLEEAVTPIATPINLSTVDAVLDQWGAVASMSDVVLLTIRHPLFQQARELLELQHNETVDREMQVVLMGSSAVTFAGTATTRATITAADRMTTDTVRRVVATLRSQGAMPYASMLRGVVDPFVEADMTADPTFVQAGTNSPGQIGTLRANRIGPWMGVEWERSNLIPILTVLAGANFTLSALTGGAIPAGATGFTAASTVRAKITRLNAQTRFEEVIGAEAAVTNAAIFAVSAVIAAAAATGIYRVYSTLEGGATGTATLQVRVNHTTGTASTVILIRGGTASAANVFIVTSSGAVAPPDVPAAVAVHLSYVMGRGHLGATSLEGLKTYVTPPGATGEDPLAQRRKASWKQLLKGIILNPDFGRRVESATAFA